MANSLDLIDTIVFVMLENRSFDHILGYLSLPPSNRADVEGLKGDSLWLAQYANPAAGGQSYGPAYLPNPDKKLVTDPPHERSNIATQLGAPMNGVYPMNGFVQSCPALDPDTQSPLVMGYYQAEEVPTADFFARHFTICDHWFASLPAGTQPNRLMSMSGYSDIDVNQDLLPSQKLVYQWLDEHNIRWKVYHDGIPFFTMMASDLEEQLFDGHFQSYNEFRIDNKSMAVKDFPQVVFIEPRYTNAPHLENPTDDHAPTPITFGQGFLKQIYSDLTANPDRWKRTLMVVTYDEHGGFFDHVSPPSTSPAAGKNYSANPFLTTGVRVPAFLISPLAEAGKVFSGAMDHTSVLKLIAQKFGNGSYSDAVDQRQIAGRPPADIAQALTLSTPRADIPLPDAQNVGFTPDNGPGTDPVAQAFQGAYGRLMQNQPNKMEARFPDLTQKF